MKRYFILSVVCLGLSACGGSGGDVASDALSAAQGSLGQPSIGGGLVPPNIESHQASFGNTAPLSGVGKSGRFDENGNLIGVYEIPYVPAKGKK